MLILTQVNLVLIIIVFNYALREKNRTIGTLTTETALSSCFCIFLDDNRIKIYQFKMGKRAKSILWLGIKNFNRYVSNLNWNFLKLIKTKELKTKWAKKVVSC